MKVISNKIVAISVSLIIVLTGLTFFSCPQKIFPQTIEDELEEVKQQREDTQKKIEEAQAAIALNSPFSIVSANLTAAMTTWKDSL